MADTHFDNTMHVPNPEYVNVKNFDRSVEMSNTSPEVTVTGKFYQLDDLNTKHCSINSFIHYTLTFLKESFSIMVDNFPSFQMRHVLELI